MATDYPVSGKTPRIVTGCCVFKQLQVVDVHRRTLRADEPDSEITK